MLVAIGSAIAGFERSALGDQLYPVIVAVKHCVNAYATGVLTVHVVLLILSELHCQYLQHFKYPIVFERVLEVAEVR